MATRTTGTKTDGMKTPTADDGKEIVELDLQIWGTSASGERIYGNFLDNYVYGGGGGDIFVGDAGSDEYHGDSEALDTVDYSNSTKGVKANLLKGFGSGGDAAGDTYNFIDNLVGSDFDDHLYGDNAANMLDGGFGDDYLAGYDGEDTLIGGDGDDTLLGGEGDDVLQGGKGRDTASYADTKGVDIDLAARSSPEKGYKGDTFSSIENLIGSRYEDTLTGDDGDNVLSGSGGDDVLVGGGGDDTLLGGTGNDTMTGGFGDNHFDGGAGHDAVDYSWASYRVSVDLEVGVGGVTAPGQGYPIRDTYTNIEDATGGSYQDVLKGNSADNYLSGMDGGDVIHGSVGSDTLDGGDGFDRAIYWDSDAAVTVDLGTGTGHGGFAEGDTLISIENITGSTYDGNVLHGSSEANYITSGGNFDLIQGRGGADSIIIIGEGTAGYGGAGDDVFRVGLDRTNPLLQTGETVGHTLDGGADTDTLKLAGTSWMYDYDESGETYKIAVDLEAGTMVRTAPTYDADNPAGGQTGVLEIHDSVSGFENVELVGQAEASFFGDDNDNILTGHIFDDTLEGRAGNDTLDGGGGADVLDGGEGIDTVHYASWTFDDTQGVDNQSVNVSLRAGTAFGFDADGDTLIDIENVVTGRGNDVVEGDEGDNEISTNAGDDILSGGGGSDILSGGLGADTFRFELDYFAPDHGVITDFEAGVDKFDIRDFDYALSAEDILADMAQVGEDVVLAYGQSTVTFENVQIGDLGADDFLV